MSQTNQVILLETSWSDLFMLTAVQWSFSIDDYDQTYLLNNIDENDKFQTLNDEVWKIVDCLRKTGHMKYDHTELTCLKALALFKTGIFFEKRIS